MYSGKAADASDASPGHSVDSEQVLVVGGRAIDKKLAGLAGLVVVGVVLCLAVSLASGGGGDGGGAAAASAAGGAPAADALPSCPNLPPACTSCRQPAHSWSTIPVFFHGSDPNGTAGGGFTDLALETITKFPIVTLEKWQGSSVVPYTWQEDAWVESARQIKAIDPTITVLVWFDTVHIYEQDTTLDPDLKDRKYESPWETSCTSGNFHGGRYLDSHPSLLLMEENGVKKALDGWGCHIYNYANPAAQCYFQKMCLQMVASGVIDGCGVDASQSHAREDQWQISKPVAERWNAGHASMLRGLRANMGNAILLGDADSVGASWGHLPDSADGVHAEHCRPTNATILSLQRMARTQPGKIIECHFQPDNDGYLLDSLAAFLIGAGEGHFFGFGFWDDIPSLGGQPDFSDHWDDMFRRRLGQPLGDGTYYPQTHSWLRAFASGTQVTSTWHAPRTETEAGRWEGVITFCETC